MLLYLSIMHVFLFVADSSHAQPHNHLQFYSQYKQDKFVYETFFRDTRNGTFVDIGANDGETLSNTLFFEEQLGWNGICIEPLPHIFEKLKNRRRCLCIQGCIADHDGTEEFLMIKGYAEMLSGIIRHYDPHHRARIEAESHGNYQKVKVNTYNLNTLLNHYGFKHIDYLSIDTEGGELGILQSIDFTTYSISVIDVENNYNDSRIKEFLASKGYRFITRIDCDEIYAHTSLLAKGKR